MIFLYLLSACVSQPDELRQTITSTPHTPTKVSATTEIPKLTSSATDPTHTHKPSAKDEVLTPTRTPQPTLSTDDALAFVRDAIDTNLGCELPCWWGILPGETKWIDALGFLNTFALEITALSSDYGYFVAFPDPENQDDRYGSYYYTKESMVDGISVPAFRTITEILGEYGTPKEIWFHSNGISAYSLPPSFIIVIFYPNDGILYFVDGQGNYINESDSTIIEVCSEHMDPSSIPWMYLWSPTTVKTFDQLKPFVYPDPDIPFHPLEQVTNLDITAFVQAFSDLENEQCIQTPADIWPFPLSPNP